MQRPDGRAGDQLRPVTITPGFLPYAEGSALVQIGSTRVICAVSVEDSAPPFLRGRGQGWLTAEYRMLPRATLVRTPREGGAVPSGRSHEIQRMIGRSLRSAVDLPALGERTLLVDCDVLQADGGTRTAAITGGYVAVVLALRRLREQGALATLPLKRAVAAVSVGVVAGELALDLCYQEDTRADVDCNVVMTDLGELVELQATAEGQPLQRQALDDLLDFAERGIRQLLQAQGEALEA